MALTSLFLNKTPNIAGIEFDAVFENTVEGSVITTGYTIETGARAMDHRIVLPYKVHMIAGVSNNPMKTLVADFIDALTDEDTNGILTKVAGLSAGFLSGTSTTRSSAALETLFTLMVTGEPFTVDCVDVQLNNMVIKNIRRTANRENQGGLVAEVELEEFPTLPTILSNDQPTLDSLNFNDPSYYQIVADATRGEITSRNPDLNIITSLVEGLKL